MAARVHDWKDHVVKAYEFNGRQTHMHAQGVLGHVFPRDFDGVF